jgi:hypothetical protein
MIRGVNSIQVKTRQDRPNATISRQNKTRKKQDKISCPYLTVNLYPRRVTIGTTRKRKTRETL